MLWELDADQRAVLDQARKESAWVLAAVHDGAALRPLNADPHGGNLRWADDMLAVFDFDDCGLGVPALDLAITTSYLPHRQRGAGAGPAGWLRRGGTPARGPPRALCGDGGGRGGVEAPVDRLRWSVGRAGVVEV
ncbi:MAG: phosphotransferase, partial [Chloroflexi bacterium]|nr:phosphotransferase [Chloroflexota bacterium]